MVGVVRRGLSAPAGLRAAAAAVVAALAGVAAFVLFLTALAPPSTAPVVAPGRLMAGDLVLAVRSAEWTGAGPVAGTRTLRLEAQLSDVGAEAAALEPGDFSVRAPGDAAWPLARPDGVGPAWVRPGEARTVDLQFEVPASEAELDLVWTHAGQVRRVQVVAAPGPPRARAAS
jgi:hypothetical protein